MAEKKRRTKQREKLHKVQRAEKCTMKAALCVIQRVGEVSTMLPPRELGV